MADTFSSGTLGRIRVGSNVNVGGITRWTLDKQVAVIPIPHFEATPDSDGIYWQDIMLGWGSATGTLEGYWNCDATNQTDGTTIGISPGLTVTLDLIIVKSTPHGFSNVDASIHNLHVEVATENQPARFTAQFTCNGSPGKATTVT